MKKGLFKNLAVWQNYAHYLLLTIAVAVFMNLVGAKIFFGEWFIPNKYFIQLYLLLFIADTLIHIIFSLLPEPYKWED